VARARRIPIVTEEDTLGIALAAAALVTLRRGGIALADARVVVAGADKVPLLTLLLMAAGVGDIASWTTVDAEGFPLSGVARDAGEGLADGAAQQWRYGVHAELREVLVARDREGVGDDDLANTAGAQACGRSTGEHTMGGRGDHCGGAGCVQKPGGADDGGP